MRIILNIDFPVMFKKFPLNAIVTIVVAIAVAGCGGAGDGAHGPDQPKVLATTTIWADVVSAVTCRKLKVPSLIRAGVDAHEFEPTVQDADRLLGADLVFTNGLGLEADMSDTIESARKSGVKVVALAPEMKPRGDDPHVWMDPDRVALAVPVIERHLVAVGGLGLDSTKLEKCADDYVAQLHDLSVSMDNELAAVPASARKLVTNHENLGYFAERFDFEVIGALIPSTSSLGESDPRTLDELSATVRSSGIKTIFVDAIGSHHVAESLAEHSGHDIEVQELFVESLGPKSDGADTYRGMMSTNAERIAKSLSR